MWFWISRRFRLWLVFALGAPVAAWVLGALADVLQRRSGETRVTRALGKGRDWAENRTRGPIARRRRRRARRGDA